MINPADPVSGYDWCAMRLTASGCAELAYEVELAKASSLLGSGHAKEAIGVYRVCFGWCFGGGFLCVLGQWESWLTSQAIMSFL